ncbi:MAG: ABC transporter ATP-binding protein [Lachnospirales bacterium]
MALKIKKLSKQYDNKIAVDNISLELQNGVYGLLGANGAGKTTFIRMLCGILKPTKGEISFNGYEVTSEKYRENLGYLPQHFGYYPDFTAYDFMMYMSSLKGLSKPFAKAKTKELLELVDLTNVEKKKIKTFSGGMKQRLGIAQALLNNPKLLILDEPTAGLDPKERVRFRNLISKLGMDRIVILSTHIVSDIEYIAKEILIMKEGCIIERGSLYELLAPIEGNIFECKVPFELTEKYINKYTIINTHEENQNNILRYMCNSEPIENSILVKAGLEDLYLFYFEGGN